MNSDTAYEILKVVLMLGLAWFGLWVSIMGVVAFWKKVVKIDKVKADHERLIIKRAETAKELLDLEEKKNTIQEEIIKLQADALAIKPVEEKAEEITLPDNEEIESEVVVEEPVKVDYDKMTTVELRQLAKARNVKGFSRMSKAELIGILRT